MANRQNVIKCYTNGPKYNGSNSSTHSRLYVVSRESFPSSNENRSSVRQLAIELVKQAYNTGPFETKFFENAKILDSVITTSLFQKYGNKDEEILDADTPIRDIYIDQMVRIALHLSQRTYTGFYSILFNEVARNMKDQVGIDFLQSLPQWSAQDYFPELYKNETLTPLEKIGLQQRHMREFNALSTAFRRAFQNFDEEPEFFRQCEESNVEDAEMDDLYSQCYNQICIMERFKATQSLQEASKATYSSPINNQIIIDDGPEGFMLWTYCLPTKDLLIAIAKNQKNPLTNTSFSSTTIDRVQHKFSTELKLIRYALSKSDIPYSLDDVQVLMFYSS